jgi:EmrB/QacA subfamily drug resistance transporter
MVRTGKWWMLAVLCLALITVSLDITILNVALPSISATLHAGTSDLQWIVDSYSLAFAGVMLPAGVLGDRWGRRRVLMTGLAVFLASSVWCALAGGVGELITARAAMGVGAAIIMPLTLAIVSATFDDAERPKAIGITTAAVALGLPLGPVLGGLLLQHYSWSSVFWINVPIAALTLAAAALLLTETRNPQAATAPLDVTGALLAVVSIVTLVFGVIRGPESGWSDPATIVPLAAAGPLAIGFGIRERRCRHPLVDLGLVRDRRFVWGTLATVAVSVALFAILFVMPQYLQAVSGADALGTGLRLTPLMIGLLLAGGAAGPLTRLLGTKIATVCGLTVLAAGLLMLAAVHTTTGYGVVATGLTVAGLGIGAAVAVPMNAVMIAVGGDEAGAGAAVNSALRQVGGALAIAGLGSVLAAGYRHSLSADTTPAARSSITEAVQVAASLPADAGNALRHGAQSAFVHGMSQVMFATVGVVAVAVVLCLLFLPRHADAPAEITTR